MRLDCRQLTARVIRRSAIGSLASFTALSGFVAAGAMADQAEDALAKLNELSRQAEQTTEAMHSAELDLGAKLAAQQAAENKLTDDQAALDAAKGQLASFQTAVNKVAAAAYMGGRANGMDTILTAPSPQLLIDGLSMQRVMAHQMATQMSGFRTAREQAAKAEQASEKSAADAKSAAEQAAAVRANLQHKQSQLQVQIAVVKSQYLALTPDQRTALADPGQVPAGLPGAPGPAPEGTPPGGPPPAGAPVPGEAPPPGGVSAMPFTPPDGAGGDRAAVVQAALTQVGTPYAWGGAAPGGFDCSGLVMWAFQQAGIALPHSSQALAHGGQPVSLSDLQPGDVLTFYSDASHAGIYIGDGLMVHSSTYGVPVRVVPMNSSGPIYDARRY
ncbi:MULTISPECIES: peptidoglycan hydrolase RipC [Mycobacterium]|uniref:Endopeptidase n=2 Tax=Mycobacterium ulcerans group TaxID=2993898 RepID=A0A9N7LU21_9MYCO|nr:MULTISPECIES: peptidoglycan hydrolase RipC [Mycobacterium]AGC63144.1 putative secreted protein [Mycobacterium liflandii 128FXT]MBC9866078.1 Cell wall-associated hydrolases (invasion-associated proteins) [Mycobacterium pseudoshottsii]BBA88755.1 putative endopeptidase [Mycobacterium pseudoshottsii JCM 15466]BDN83032.1 putative endopeptidase [Mycobacterium pseudoshottsii]BEH77422.1 putative endopeptidase [Mycobacterium pseudoshottsii]